MTFDPRCAIVTAQAGSHLTSGDWRKV